MRCKIGTFESLTGLNQATLRYYDKLGLLSPTRDDDNGYRYYDERDLISLVQIKQYSNLGIALGELPTVDNSPSTEEMHSLFSEKRIELEAQIESMMNLLSRIKIHENKFKALTQDIGKVIREKTGGIYRLFLTDPQVESHPETQSIVKRWLTHMPYTHATLRIRQSEIEDEQVQCYTADLGLGMLQRYFAESGEVFQEPIVYTPLTNVISGVIEVNDLSGITREELLPFFEMMEKESLMPIGDMYGWIIYTTRTKAYLSLRIAVG